MGICTHELMPELEHKDGFHFKITVESGIKGLCRINVACLKEDSDEEENSQGTDLFPSECRSLAHMLLSVADLLDGEVKESAIRKKLQ